MAEERTDTDWVAIERSTEFQELTRSKRAFVVPATIFFMVWYFGFIVLCGYAPRVLAFKLDLIPGLRSITRVGASLRS